jgi:hypothetical protein
VNLARDVLDKQVTDRAREPLGRVDGIVIVLRRNQPPRAQWLEIGMTTLGRRIHPRLAAAIERLERWLGVHDGKPLRLAFDRIRSAGIDVHVDIDGRRTTALVWEQWWRRILGHIPGAGDIKE